VVRTPKVISIAANKPKNPAAVALGRLGGLKGGAARAAKLSPQERKEIAQRAAKQRWANRKSDVVGSLADQTEAPERATKLR